MKYEEIFDIILKIIIIILSLLIIFWLLQLIFGGSPSVEDLLIGIVILICGLVLHHNREIGIIKNDSKHNFLNIKNSFINIKNDFKYLKKDSDLIKNKLK